MGQINVAIVGVGRISDMHAPGYLNHPDAKIHTVCDIDKDLVARRKQEWKAEKAVTDFRAVLDDPKIDLIEILTPHHVHCEMVEQAAAAGKHISIQKPMALTAAECERMIVAAKNGGVKLKVFENFVFYPPYVMAKKLMEEGEIGEVLSVRFKLSPGGGGWRVPLTTWIWRLDRRRCGPGPTIFDDGNHKFSQAYDLLGPIDEVFGYIDYTMGVIDGPAAISWTYKNSPAVGCFDISFSPNLRMRGKYYGADERVEITGTKGTLLVTRCTAQMVDEPPLWLIKDGRVTGFEDLRHDWLDAFVDSTRHMIEAIKNDGDPKLTGEAGKYVLQFSLAAYVAAHSGERVRPEDVNEFKE